MTNSPEPESADDASGESTQNDAPGADEMEESVQRGGNENVPPMGLDSVQGSRTGEDDKIIGRPRDR